MKLVTYHLKPKSPDEQPPRPDQTSPTPPTAGDGPRLGAMHPEKEQIIDLHAASDRRLPVDMRSFLNLGPEGMAVAIEALGRADVELFAYQLNEVKLLAPIHNPQKIVAIGRNYEEHALEQKRQPPSKPLIFAIYPSAIIGPEDPITWDSDLTQQVDFEGELAVIIGRTARHVPEADALEYVAGYTILNDVSARDLQYGDKQYTRGKSLDTFCPLGPWLVTRDDLPNPQALAIETRVNGQQMQAATTGDMIFQVPYLIAYISRAFTLYPGDIIATGTPGGVGVFREPPIFLQDGDVVEIEIEGIGHLLNPCRIVKA